MKKSRKQKSILRLIITISFGVILFCSGIFSSTTTIKSFAQYKEKIGEGIDKIWSGLEEKPKPKKPVRDNVKPCRGASGIFGVLGVTVGERCKPVNQKCPPNHVTAYGLCWAQEPECAWNEVVAYDANLKAYCDRNWEIDVKCHNYARDSPQRVTEGVEVGVHGKGGGEIGPVKIEGGGEVKGKGEREYVVDSKHREALFNLCMQQEKYNRIPQPDWSED